MVRHNKPGAGRPREIADPVRIGLSIEAKERERLIAASKKMELSGAGIIRTAIKEWLDKNG